MTSNENQKKLAEDLDKVFAEYDSKTHGYLEIAVIGEVSSGKSSFLNALFDCPKSEPKFSVSARAGETKVVKFELIGSHLRILDTPGLQDTDKTNSEKTKNLLNKGVDIGILVLQGAATESQRANLDLLKEKTNKNGTENFFVVLNKVDQHSKEILQQIKIQWREVLNLDPNTQIYEVSCKGYDDKDKLIDPITSEEMDIPIDEFGIPKTIRGVQDVKDEIFKVCFSNGKIAFIANAVSQKQPAAMGIIATACAASVGAILVPGTALIIGATQATAISSLFFLYKGSFPDKTEVARIMSVFGKGTGLGLGAVTASFVMSFLPPTGVLELSSIMIIVPYMSASLLLVNFLLSKGMEIKNSDTLDHEFERVNKKLIKAVATVNFLDIPKISKADFWRKLLANVQITL
jgi:GTP-binding protein EngB required for normal cell division